MVIKPAGYSKSGMNIQHELDRRFMERPEYQNVIYAALHSGEPSGEKKKIMWKALRLEVAWVTHGGLEPLTGASVRAPDPQRLLFCDFYAKGYSTLTR